MEILKMPVRFLGRITWRIGRVPAQLDDESQANEWYERYGLSSLVLALLFVGWEATLSAGSRLQVAISQLRSGQELLARAAGLGLLIAVAVSRVLIAVFLLGMLLTLFRMLVGHRSRD